MQPSENMNPRAEVTKSAPAASAQANSAATPLGAQAAAVYALYEAAGQGDKDFSGIINLLRGAN